MRNGNKGNKLRNGIMISENERIIYGILNKFARKLGNSRLGFFTINEEYD